MLVLAILTLLGYGFFMSMCLNDFYNDDLDTIPFLCMTFGYTVVVYFALKYFLYGGIL